MSSRPWCPLGTDRFAVPRRGLGVSSRPRPTQSSDRLARSSPSSRRRLLQVCQGRLFMKKKLTLSKETLRTLDEKELSQIVGGEQSGSNEPPRGEPNSCPN